MTESKRVLTSKIAEDVLLNREQIIMSEFTDIEPEAARQLIHYHGDLDLRGLRTLSVEAAGYLSQHAHGDVLLDGLEDLTDAVASKLGSFKKPYMADTTLLSLDGLTTISASAAKSFRTMERHLSLQGLRNVAEDAKRCLANRCSKDENGDDYLEFDTYSAVLEDHA